MTRDSGRVCSIQSPNHRGPVTSWVAHDAHAGARTFNGPQDLCDLHRVLLGAVPGNPRWAPAEEDQ